MLRTDLPDYRRVSEAELVAALRKRDPLALAEAYHRTIPAAHATARRLVSSSVVVEALLRAVYDELWRNPPLGAGLEGWVRGRTFDLGVDHLRSQSTAPASPSLSTLLPDLPKPDVRYLDAAERSLAELDDRQRRALLLAHDRGIPSERQDEEGAPAALISALFALAGPEPGGEQADGDCNVAGVGDWVLGLLSPDRAAQVSAAVTAESGCESVVKALRRGRRRLEGLPPTPDMGQRILVVVLAGAPAPAAVASGTLRSALDADDDLGMDVGATTRMSPLGADDEDTGDLGAAGAEEELEGEGVPASGDATAAYAELAALDESDDQTPLPPPPDDDDLGDYERRSAGGRVLAVILGIVIVLAGIGAGLAIGWYVIGGR